MNQAQLKKKFHHLQGQLHKTELQLAEVLLRDNNITGVKVIQSSTVVAVATVGRKRSHLRTNPKAVRPIVVTVKYCTKSIKDAIKPLWKSHKTPAEIRDHFRDTLKLRISLSQIRRVIKAWTKTKVAHRV